MESLAIKMIRIRSALNRQQEGGVQQLKRAKMGIMRALMDKCLKIAKGF